MDIKQLKFLIALDETRHFGQAAARCHITQPTLSMRLRNLEDELDLVLVNRGHATGAQLLGLARRIAGSVQERFGVALEPEPRIIGSTW